MLFAIVFT